MATSMDKGAIQEAYSEVMADKNNVEWAAFTFTDNTLGVTAKGHDFEDFKSNFGPDDRGFGYIKIAVRFFLGVISLIKISSSDWRRAVQAI